MKILAAVSNVVLFAITCYIGLTEGGIPSEVPYLILTLLPLSIPILSLIVLLRGGMTREGQRTRDDPSSGRILINRVSVFCNLILLLAFSCWAALAQYLYLEGNGVIPFGLFMVFTPIVSVAALFRGGKGNGQEQPRTIAHQR